MQGVWAMAWQGLACKPCTHSWSSVWLGFGTEDADFTAPTETLAQPGLKCDTGSSDSSCVDRKSQHVQPMMTRCRRKGT